MVFCGVKCGILRWFEHVMRVNVNDFVNGMYKGKIKGVDEKGRLLVRWTKTADRYSIELAFKRLSVLSKCQIKDSSSIASHLRKSSYCGRALEAKRNKKINSCMEYIYKTRHYKHLHPFLELWSLDHLFFS